MKKIQAELNAASQVDTWSALSEVMPEIQDYLTYEQPDLENDIEAYPGLPMWLTTQFALGFPSRVVARHLRKIITEQNQANVMPWKDITARDLNTWRNRHKDRWQPAHDRLLGTIEEVGVVQKKRRLLALQTMWEGIEELMWEKEDTQDRMYLLKEGREVLQQIAEEKGEIGMSGDTSVDALFDLSKLMLEAVQNKADIIPEYQSE
jgi:hypothetical protein